MVGSSGSVPVGRAHAISGVSGGVSGRWGQWVGLM